MSCARGWCCFANVETLETVFASLGNDAKCVSMSGSFWSRLWAVAAWTLGVTWVFGCDAEDRVVSSSDIFSRHCCRLQLLLKSNQDAYSGDQDEGECGEHG